MHILIKVITFILLYLYNNQYSHVERLELTKFGFRYLNTIPVFSSSMFLAVISSERFNNLDLMSINTGSNTVTILPAFSKKFLNLAFSSSINSSYSFKNLSLSFSYKTFSFNDFHSSICLKASVIIIFYPLSNSYNSYTFVGLNF